MKNLLAVSAVLLLFGTPGRGQDRRLLGAWRLAWLEQTGADGKLHKTDCCGLLVFTSDGHMSVQVMEAEPQSQAPSGSESYSQGGYEASYGTYQVDKRTHTFIFHVKGALVRKLVGRDLPRTYEFSGKQLMIRSTRPEEHWRVAWEHY